RPGSASRTARLYRNGSADTSRCPTPGRSHVVCRSRQLLTGKANLCTRRSVNGPSHSRSSFTGIAPLPISTRAPTGTYTLRCPAPIRSPLVSIGDSSNVLSVGGEATLVAEYKVYTLLAIPRP